MKIAINTLPLKTGHKDRGIGNYTANLIEALKSEGKIEIIEFTNLSQIKDADLVHYPWFDFYYHTLPIKKPFPTVVTIHDVIPLKFKEHFPTGVKARFSLGLQKLALSSVKQILTDSNVSKKDITDLLGIKQDKISVVHLSVGEDFKQLTNTESLFAKRKYQLPDRYLLYVGDANWTKNIPFLIESFNELVKNDEFKDVKLVLIGGVFLKKVENINHRELESLKLVNRLIEQYRLTDQIIRPGNIETKDLVAFYNLATIYIQPSIYEGFGLPIIEAMACGAPVVSSNGGSLVEVGGQAPVYFNPTNSQQVFTLIKEILASKSLQNKLSELGLKRAQQFSPLQFASEMIKIYSQIINS